MKKINNLTGLIIMDGLGIPKDLSRSAVLKENTLNLQRLSKEYPSGKLQASEIAVGLPVGQAGTSEVGHLTMGIGRVAYQPLVKLNNEIENGNFFKNKTLLDAFENVRKNNSDLHLIGLVSDGGIHSHINHLFALLDMAKKNKVKNVYVHFIADGRDTPIKSALNYISQLENYMKKIGVGKIASVAGRYYALDRDKNWDRVKVAYDAYVYGNGKFAPTAKEAVENAYLRNETDEFILPTILMHNNSPIAIIKPNDSVISFNFRADRERQLAYVFDTDNTLDYTNKKLKIFFVCMMEYDSSLKNVYVAYEKDDIKNILSEVVCKANLSQIKLAETEKYAHVTFFFNNGKMEEFKNEKRVLINSPKMKSYASVPQMSAEKVMQEAIDAINSKKYDLFVVNFANCDMVGHSGDKSATIKAVDIVDNCVAKVVDAVLKQNGNVIVTADHGNADIMEYEDGSACASHTTNLVPCIIVGEKYKNYKFKPNGSLADIAPTILKLMGLDKPVDMTGVSLLEK